MLRGCIYFWAAPRAVCLALLASSFCAAVRANTPPEPPVITEPSFDGDIVNPEDVHMETGPFVDADPNSEHLCTDWEIWQVTPTERVWVTACIRGVEKLHTSGRRHL